MMDVSVRKNIRHGQIIFGGNYRQKIYGHLNCSSGKKLKKDKRVFFTCMDEVFLQGFRPCGNCMKAAYKKWKDGFV